LPRPNSLPEGEDYIFGASLEASAEASTAGAEASTAAASVASVVTVAAGSEPLQAERAKTPAIAAARTILRIYGNP
ncbi:MAG: hypothetical protein ABIW31_07655, partial [Novosphingobium sp.]